MTDADGLDLVDPADPVQVAAVLAAAFRGAGIEGVADVLARVPGVQVTASTPAGFLRKATPASVWIGAEHRVTLTSAVEHHHVVGGVTLSHATVAPARVGELLAPLLVRVIHDQGAQQEAALALTAARDAYAGF